MFFKDLFDLTLGRLIIPPRTAAPPGNQEGELWLDRSINRARLRSLISGSPTLQQLLSDLDRGIPNGVAPLGADGVIPAAFLPVAAGGTGGILVGSIHMWDGDPLAIPGGYLACDGSEVPIITQYQALYDVIGNKHGQPSTPGYFKLPSYNGRMPMGSVSGSVANSGAIHKCVIRSPGQNYTDGTFVATATGGTFSTPAQATIIVAGGKVVSVQITTPGAYTNLGTAPSSKESNCAVLWNWAVGFGFGFQYDIFAAPTTSASQGWGVRMTNRGAGYASVPLVTIGGTLTGATGVAVLEGGVVRGVTITNPGTGNPAGATIGFSGGTPTTPATASPIFWTTQTAVGDVGGEQQHLQLQAELGPHPHLSDRGASADPFGGVQLGAYPLFYINPPGGNQPTPNLPPFFGTLYLIKY